MKLAGKRCFDIYNDHCYRICNVTILNIVSIHSVPIMRIFIYILSAFGFFPSKRQASVTQPALNISPPHTLEAISSLQSTHIFGFVTMLRRFQGSGKFHIPQSVICRTKTNRGVCNDLYLWQSNVINDMSTYI